MRISLLITFFILPTIYSLKAQNETDALKYSQNNIFGNARFVGMSGSFGALGGEFSSLSQNPAGIGMYQNNEISFTPNFSLNNTKSYYGANHIESDKMTSNISSLGIVFSTKKESDWKRINLALGWNKLASYEQDIRIEGINKNSSIADKLLEIAQGKTIDELDDFFSYPAFATDVIDLTNNTTDSSNQYLFDNGNYISHVNSNASKLQRSRFLSSGSKNEFILSFGGSYKENIYLGATIGFPRIENYQRTYYSEDMLEDTINGLQAFDFGDELSVYGDGINIKAGAILRLAKNVKLGINLHTPTIFNIEETYSTSMTTYFNQEGAYSYNSVYGYNSYQLITPWKAAISGSTIINNFILINLDYELIDYSFSKMNSEIYDFRYENEQIKEKYQQTNNVRIGTELNINPFILRAGASIYGSPYKEIDQNIQNYTFGLGVDNGRYFFDIGYILTQGNSKYQLYSEDYINPIPIAITNHNLVMTAGFRY